jgi:hypothetical protein
MQLTDLIPIALIAGLVEVVKMIFPLPDKFVKPLAFFLALLFAILGTYDKELVSTIVSIITYALGAAGAYSFVIKPVKSVFTDKPSEQ